MIHPLAYIVLTSALSVVLVAAGLAGQAALAAELAVIQGALLATFYAFSANTRSLILQGHGDLTPERLLGKRVVALPLLAVASYVLCVAATGVSPLLALLLIARRACEWLAEVRLCEIEVAGEKRLARRAIAIQALVTLGVALVLGLAPQAAVPALAVFALSPLLASPPRLRLAAFRIQTLAATLRGASPHIGSTAIDGISTYVLRLVVFLIAGPEMAGLLFTAFVLGSFMATLFANVLGPSLALRARRGEAGHAVIGWAVRALGASGIAISVAALATRLAPGFGKPGYFWLALGLSLLGAAIMILVQILRLRLFEERRAEVLFGPDVLRNLTAIIAAPTLYYLVAPAALGGLYLALVVLTAFVYWGAARHAVAELPAGWSEAARFGIAFLVLLPLFFLLSGRLYRNPGAPLLDPGGSLMSVPLPVSLAACFAGIVLLGRYRHAVVSLGTIFFLFVAMVLTSIVVSAGDIAYESRKFLLLFQFLVPAFALVLGQMFGAPRQGLRIAAGAFAVVLAVVVPVQMLRSIGWGEHELYHDVWAFSVYQHLQYVPSVFVCAYLVALYALWERPGLRRVLAMGGALMGWYVAMAYSTLAIVLLGSGVLLLAMLRWREPTARWCAAVAIAASATALFISQNTVHVWQKFETSREATERRLTHAPAPGVSRSVIDALPGPAQVRLHYWALFGRGIVESGRSTLFGHAQAVDRSVAPSAHNYYLDFVYNFGVLAFLPFAWLIGYTLLLLWRERALLRADLPLLGLALAVMFGLACESMFKVPLRQPYPGIFFFFLWGLLIARLQFLRR